MNVSPATTTPTPSAPVYAPPGVERSVVGKLGIRFGFDGYLQSADKRVGDGQGYATLAAAEAVAKDFAGTNKTAVVFELPTPLEHGAFVVHEAIAGPGGFTDVTPGSYALGAPVETRGTAPSSVTFTEPLAKALISAKYVLENASGHDKFRL